KYGMIRKLPVFFDLLTVRFLLRYLSRPLHFFGSAGFLGMFVGSAIGFWLLVDRLVYGVHIMGEHGPLLIFAAVFIVAVVQLMALVLLSKIHSRYPYEGRGRSNLNETACIIRGSVLPAGNKVRGQAPASS